MEPYPGWRRDNVVQLTLDEPALSPRELAVRFTDTQRYFVSEASVYRLLKAHDLIASPAFIVVKAADAFKDKTAAPTSCGRPISPMEVTDFTYGGDRLGLVLPVDRAGRLLPLQRSLEAVHQHAGRGCHRDARPSATGQRA